MKAKCWHLQYWTKEIEDADWRDWDDCVYKDDETRNVLHNVRVRWGRDYRFRMVRRIHIHYQRTLVRS